MAKKQPAPTVVDRSGLGWSLSDFGIAASTGKISSINPNRPQVAPGQTTGGPSTTATASSDFTLGLTGGGVGQRIIPTTPTTLTKTATNGVDPQATQLGGKGAVEASKFLTPEQQNQVKNYLENPNILQSAANVTKSFMSTLFDTSDDDKSGLFGLERPWDAMLGAIGWSYDRLSQLESAGLSGLPGGIQTLTWEQADKVSPGQVIIANQGVSAGKIRRGEANFGDFISMSPIGVLGGILAPDSPIQQKGYDITTPEGKKAFESGPEKFFSGVTDLGLTIFADPLILAGKGAKLARIKWIDRPMTVEQATNELATGAIQLAAGETGRMSPIAQFAEWTSRKVDEVDASGAAILDDAGNVVQRKAVTMSEIYNHPVVKRAANRDGVAAALYNADNYDQAALVIRYAKGDVKAFDELAALRPDILADIAASHRTMLETVMRFNPAAKQKLEGKYQNIANAMNDELDRTIKEFGENSQEAAFARRQLNQANENYQIVADYRLPDPLVTGNATKEEVQAARRAFKEMENRDKALQRALGSERERINNNYFSMELSTKGFAADNAFGRMVEGSRQRRATAAYQQAATRNARVATDEMIRRPDGSLAPKMRSLHFWETDDFGNSGIVRAARMWRWMGNETPSGFITTKGVGSLESSREMNAVLNDVPIYSGGAREITVDGEKILVGGLKRKEELLNMYRNALAEEGIKGTEGVKLAVDRIENEIAKDIAAWHGITKKSMDDIMEQTNSKRQGIIDSLKETGYWVDNVKGQTQRNYSPYLESQLQNGTFMVNWRAMEKAARLFDETPWVRRADDTAQFAQDKASTIYSTFNDVWRPAVLMRLGYTQRNVTEGLFRSSAFLFSLDPLKYAIQNGAFSIRNAYVHQTMRGAVEQATVAAREGRALPSKFTKWQQKQITLREENINRLNASIAQIEEGVAEFMPEIRNDLYKRYEDMANTAADDLVRLKNQGGTAKEIAEANARLKEANSNLTRIDKMGNDVISDTASQAARDAAENLPYLRQMLDDSIRQRALLDQQDSAVAMFRQQATAKRRVFDGSYIGPDGNIVREAFARDSDYTDIALMNMSADNTTKATMSLQMDSLQNIFKAQTMRFNVAVQPGDKGYFQGVAEMLRQFQTSEVGKMVINGDSPERIAIFLRKTPVGREIAGFVTDSQVSRKGSGITFKPVSLDEGVEYAQELINRYNQLAPSPDLKEFLKTNFLQERSDMGETVRMFLDRKDANGAALYELKPAIGNIAELTGHASVRSIWANTANTMFKVLGTIPEDALVRAPFYGIRYKEAVNGMIAQLKSLPDETVTFKEIAAVQRIAHRRALKDTKDWLYTIDRRTNLGKYGEAFLPFVSAAQNSATTVGRIIWNDPSVAAIMAAVWRAPNQAGFEDAEGNIRIPIPHSFLPDGVEDALGLSNMTDFKVNKSQLNVVMPESGFGVLPRFGPIVGAPVSEIMKHGWFGMSVEAPAVLTGMFGKEAGDQLWTAWKSYAFGEGQGLSSSVLSLDMFTPPVAAKILQMWQGEGSSSQYAYYYNLQFRNEMANWSAGYRDEPPTAEEIKQRTNGFYMVRILANLAAFTPPTYESKLDPLIQAVRANDRNFGIDGARMSNDQFGNLLLMLGDFSNSKNIAGATPTADTVGNARKYSSLIQKISPDLGTDLSVLGMLLNDNPNAYYDDSAYNWQFATQIPGVSENFRELQTPEMAWRESQKNAGWTAYIKLMDGLDAALKSRGLDSYRSAAAADLREMKKQAIEQLRVNPLYAGWYDDYRDFGSTRTINAVETMRAALADETFVEDHKESPVWQAAAQYMAYRQKVLEGLKARGTGIDNNDNQDIRNYWDTVRADLISQYNGWGTFANRYLNGDDNPAEPSTVFSDFPTTDVVQSSTSNGTIPLPPQDVNQYGLGQ